MNKILLLALAIGFMWLDSRGFGSGFWLGFWVCFWVFCLACVSGRGSGLASTSINDNKAYGVKSQ